MKHTRDTTTISIRNHTKELLEDLRSNYNDVEDIGWDDFFIQLCDYIKQSLDDDEM